MKVTGVQLVTGADVKLSMGDMFAAMGNKEENKDEKQKVKAQPMAGVAIALAVLALILVLVLPKKLFLVPVLVSIAGIVCLQLLKGGMMSALSSSNSGLDPSMDLSKILSIQPKLGYWLANVFFFLGGLVATGLALINREETIYTPINEPMPFSEFDNLDDIEPLPTAVPLGDEMPENATDTHIPEELDPQEDKLS
jgi:hypothetical protein